MKNDDLLVQIQQWPTEWMTALETRIDESLTEEDTTQHREVSGMDKDEKESEQEEKYSEGHQDHLEGDEENKEFKKIETDQVVKENMKAHAEATIRRKNKKKVDKTKDITPMILTHGDFDHIGDKI